MIVTMKINNNNYNYNNNNNNNNNKDYYNIDFNISDEEFTL